MPQESIQQLMNDLRNILSPEFKEFVPTEEQLCQFNEQYSEVVHEYNQRLHECERLIRMGHRSEALFSARIDPALFEVALVCLDRAQQEKWCNLVRQFGLIGTSQLRFDVVEKLREENATEVALADLLGMHRLHAMARSPIKTRIDIMRKIAEVDTSNSVWLTDIQSYEVEYHQQLGILAEQAIRTGKTEELTQLEEQLRDPAWCEPPPQALIDAVRGARLHLQQQRAATMNLLSGNSAAEEGTGDGIAVLDAALTVKSEPAKDLRAFEARLSAMTPSDSRQSWVNASYLDDLVEFSVFRPVHLSSGKWYTILAFAYAEQIGGSRHEKRPPPTREALQLAQGILGPQIQRYKRTSQECACRLLGDEELKFVPELLGAEFNPPFQTIRWIEPMHHVAFRVSFSKDTAGQIAPGRMTVLLREQPIAELTFNIRVKPHDFSQANLMFERARAVLEKAKQKNAPGEGGKPTRNLVRADGRAATASRQEQQGKDVKQETAPSSIGLKREAINLDYQTEQFQLKEIVNRSINQGQVWYYSQGENELGPVPFEELRQLAKKGGLRRGVYVWTEGLADWLDASCLEESFGITPTGQ